MHDQLPELDEWYIVKCPEFCDSGFQIASWNGSEWDHGHFSESVHPYVEGFYPVPVREIGSTNSTASKILKMLDDDEKMEDFLKSRSKLHTSYSLKNKDGDLSKVVDIESVISLLRVILE